MDETPDNIVLQHLRDIRKDTGALKQGQRQTNERLAAIEHHMAGFHGSLVRFDSVVDGLERRVERLERRLSLSEDPADKP